jgi:hypothetical protein
VAGGGASRLLEREVLGTLAHGSPPRSSASTSGLNGVRPPTSRRSAVGLGPVDQVPSRIGAGLWLAAVLCTATGKFI